jgi:hypothetical protein
VTRKPCPANGFVSAGGHRDDVPTAAFAEERDRLFSFTPIEPFGHREELCVRLPGGLRVVWAALGASGVHFARIFPARNVELTARVSGGHRYFSSSLSAAELMQ